MCCGTYPTALSGPEWETDAVTVLDETARQRLALSAESAQALDDAVSVLRQAGAVFALLHGSTVTGRAGARSDLDVAAWWRADPPAAFEVLLPSRVDLMVLNSAPLELAGRVAVHGVVLFDDDPAARVHWVAQTRTIYFDERPRIERSHAEFAESLRRGR